MFSRQGLRIWHAGLRRSLSYAPNKQIVLHPTGSHTVASLSTNPSALSLGWSSSKDIQPSTFEPNGKFLILLHEIISKRIQEDFSFIVEAGANALTYMPIYDFREVPRYGRTPEVDNIFGYVLVDSSGKIVEGSYEKNDLYRLCNGAGLVKLSDFLYETMKEATEKAGD